MNGPDFILIVQLTVSILQHLFAMMDAITIIDAAPRLSVYGLAIFSAFAVMTADFINEIRSSA